MTGGPGAGAHAWIDVYSGRPAPEWTLTPEETEELLSLLATLASGGAPPPAGLGYRGVLVSIPGDSGVATLRAGGGVVEPEAEAGEALADPGRRVERYLWKSARRHLAPDVIETLEPHAHLEP
ncbi:MAG TPA: hypothetical protein VGA30_06990 [Actinomycetota bacterium]